MTILEPTVYVFQKPWDLKEGVLLEQLEDLVLVVELGDVDGRLPIQVLECAAVHG